MMSAIIPTSYNKWVAGSLTSPRTLPDVVYFIFSKRLAYMITAELSAIADNVAVILELSDPSFIGRGFSYRRAVLG